MTPVWANTGHPLNQGIGDFVSYRLYGHPGAFRDYTALGVFQGSTLVAGLVYCDYDRNAGVIQISGAADTPRWLTRKVLWEMFAWPFLELGCQTVAMRVDPDDMRLKRILTSYGFTCHVLPRLRGRDKDEALYLLHDDVWRENRFHQQNQAFIAG